MGKGLSPEAIVRRIREAAEPVVASFGLMLWGIEVVSGGRTVARIYVDAPAADASSEAGNGEDGTLEGVSVDQCAEISRMSAWLWKSTRCLPTPGCWKFPPPAWIVCFSPPVSSLPT